MDYLRDPDEIYARSFATIRAEADVSALPEDIATVAVRMMHACGMTDLVPDLRYDERSVVSARQALGAGAPILVDAQMVAAAIIVRHLPAGNQIVCTLTDARTPGLAQQLKTTRSAAAVSLWQDRLAGSLVVIGNAPTALFALLELIDETGIKPAAIIAMPVGFVGAAESKGELADNPRGVPFVTLAGRRGGSAIAAAAFNAIAAGAA